MHDAVNEVPNTTAASCWTDGGSIITSFQNLFCEPRLFGVIQKAQPGQFHVKPYGISLRNEAPNKFRDRQPTGRPDCLYEVCLVTLYITQLLSG